MFSFATFGNQLYSGERTIALRGLSWIVNPYEEGGVVIASEITLGAEIDKRSLHIDPMRGADMTAAYAKAFSFPPEIISAVRDVMGAR